MKKFILIGLICMGGMAQASSVTSKKTEKTELERLAWNMAMRSLPDGRRYKSSHCSVRRYVDDAVQAKQVKAKSDEILADWNQQRDAMQEKERSILDGLIAKYREEERAAVQELVKSGKPSCPTITSWTSR